MDIDKIKKVLDSLKGTKVKKVVFLKNGTVEIDGKRIFLEESKNKEEEIQEMIQEIKKKLKELESK